MTHDLLSAVYKTFFYFTCNSNIEGAGARMWDYPPFPTEGKRVRKDSEASESMSLFH